MHVEHIEQPPSVALGSLAEGVEIGGEKGAVTGVVAPVRRVLERRHFGRAPARRAEDQRPRVDVLDGARGLDRAFDEGADRDAARRHARVVLEPEPRLVVERIGRDGARSAGGAIARDEAGDELWHIGDSRIDRRVGGRAAAPAQGRETARRRRLGLGDHAAEIGGDMTGDWQRDKALRAHGQRGLVHGLDNDRRARPVALRNSQRLQQIGGVGVVAILAGVGGVVGPVVGRQQIAAETAGGDAGPAIKLGRGRAAVHDADLVGAIDQGADRSRGQIVANAQRWRGGAGEGSQKGQGGRLRAEDDRRAARRPAPRHQETRPEP